MDDPPLAVDLLEAHGGAYPDAGRRAVGLRPANPIDAARECQVATDGDAEIGYLIVDGPALGVEPGLYALTVRAHRLQRRREIEDHQRPAQNGAGCRRHPWRGARLPTRRSTRESELHPLLCCLPLSCLSPLLNEP